MSIPVITGPGDFDIQVVGQRHRQADFKQIYHAHNTNVGALNVRAQLGLSEENNFDSKAISVRVDGRLLGFLPMDVALDFRRAVVDGDLADYTVFECAAEIRIARGGNSTADDEFQIAVDLPQDTDERSRPHHQEERIEKVDSPLIKAYRSEAVIDRQIDELIGVIKGVTADGIVTQAEVEYLLCWMDANRKASTLWPAKVIYPRLVDAIHGGAMSIEKESEILDLLIRAVGGNTATRDGHESNSSKLPYTGMNTPVTFEGLHFCFTGTFASGSRNWCHGKVVERGGNSVGTISKKLNYLVVGDIGSENWLHSTHGRKIEKAVKYNADGCNIAILSEEYWHAHL